MVINSTNNTLDCLSALIQDTRVQERIRSRKTKKSNIINFPNQQILEQEVARANFASIHTDQITADFTSRQYFTLLLVAGSRSLHRARVLSATH